MKLNWNNIPIKVKIFAPCLIIILLFILVITLYFLPNMEENLLSEKRAKIRDIVYSAHGIIQKNYERYRNGEITEDEARKCSIQAVSSMRYEADKKNYVAISDYDHIMVSHINKDLIGKDFSKAQDAQGKYFSVEFKKVAVEKGEGYVDYFWKEKAFNNRSVPKIAFVKAFKPWGWVITTGIYIEDVTKQINSLYREAVVFLAVLSVVVLILVFFIVKKITGPIKRCLFISDEIAAGNLGMQVEDDFGKDEIGHLAKNILQMKESLYGIIKNISTSASALLNSSSEINATSEALSQSASEEAANVEEITSSIEEIQGSIAQNTSNSKDTNRIAQSAAEQARDGGRSVEETMNAINLISEKISLIEEIAAQTNLLALNAAIEAARAGTYGKGFAVVATEVRKLSEKSRVAAQDIGDLARQGVSVGQNAYGLIGKIVDSIIKTADLVSEITTASEEQVLGVNQISKGMNQLNEVTQVTASSAEELAATSDVLNTHAGELKRLIDYFKLNGSDHMPDTGVPGKIPA